jgi:hypothetical protein
VPVDWVREQLRDAFTRWGLPNWLRVDNGHPWGSKGDLPTDLALWLIGLAIHLWWNGPRRPQDNGVVERSQGTSKRWGEPHTCAHAEELQARLDDLDDLQRCNYPYKGKMSRMAWYPGLEHSGRVYQRSEEGTAWQWQHVLDHLSGYCVPRKVDQKGQISIYNRNHYVGTSHRQDVVWVMFNGEQCQWAIRDGNRRIFKEIDAEELKAERILALEVTHRR